MKRAGALFVLILLTASLFATANRRPAAGADDLFRASGNPPFLTPPCAEGIITINDCPLTGCGELGDAELNRAKNRTDAPTSVKRLTLDQIRQIPQPARWNTGADRSSIRASGKEGSGVVVSGYLLKARAEGKESCNCDLSRRVDTDVHLVIVSEMPASESKEAMDISEQASVTAEITPRVRGQNEKWLYRNVNDLEGSYIRITGLLMLDTKHIPQAIQLPGERGNRPLKRGTNWEVHPVTKIEVCTQSQKNCDTGKGWKAY
jgi:hypothetical protein